MRRFVGFVAATGTIVAIPTTLLLAAFTWQFLVVADHARPEPQPLTFAELIKSGAGDNLHVELTDFSFGPPIIEDQKGEWQGVWLPLFTPGHRPKGATPPALFYARQVKNQQELDELIKQKSITALVSSALPESSQKIAPAAQLYEPYPKIDPQRTIVLTEPVLIIAGRTILPAEHWFDPMAARVGWMGSGAALLMAVLCGFIWHRANRRPKRNRGAPADLRDHSRLSDEHPVSIHTFLSGRVAGMALGYLIGILVAGLITLLATASAVEQMRKGEAENTVIFAIFALGAGAGTIALLVHVFNELVYPVTRIAIYRGGIRWQRGGTTYTARWSDIDAFYKQDLIIFRNGEQIAEHHNVTLVMQDGRKLHFDYRTLENYYGFAESVQSAHASYMLHAKERELAEFGEAEFGSIVVRHDGLTVDGTEVPWTNLERYDVQNGHLCLYANNSFWFSKCKSIPLNSIPNYITLVEMLRPKAICY